MSDGPTDCARAEERAKREAIEEGYIWENLSKKERSRWMFWHERPKYPPKTTPKNKSQTPVKCIDCKFYNSKSQLCYCTSSPSYGLKVTRINRHSHIIYAPRDNCEFYTPPPPNRKPNCKSMRSNRKLLLID